MDVSAPIRSALDMVIWPLSQVARSTNQLLLANFKRGEGDSMMGARRANRTGADAWSGRSGEAFPLSLRARGLLQLEGRADLPMEPGSQRPEANDSFSFNLCNPWPRCGSQARYVRRKRPPSAAQPKPQCEKNSNTTIG
jgi:hypothetical protein